MIALVTGATGFLGSAVARRLLSAGFRVRVLARAGGNRANIQGLDVEIAEGDLTDTPALARAVAGCEALFHVAADYRLWVRDVAAMNRVNIDGSVALLRAAAAAGVGRMVYTSSVATLGINPDGTPATEETPSSLDDMIGAYKRSKFLAEAAVRRLVDKEGLPVVIVNPSAPVGPRDIRPTPTGKMILEAALGQMPAFVDTGLNLAHVDDVAEGHWLAFDRGQVGERYILGGDNLSLREILTAIAAITHRPAPKVCLPHAAVMPFAVASELWARLFGGEPFATVDGLRMSKKRMYFSSEKAKCLLGYQPRPAVDGLRDAVAWFRDHGYPRIGG
ncbi:MAG: NAD-dependent epimerase/dehydratase family protein [Alphaproteobacteria bacterium]|nr:NAD-dependent epimerase/dehydratase family protein [Alphaproteobacteria bacterium]